MNCLVGPPLLTRTPYHVCVGLNDKRRRRCGVVSSRRLKRRPTERKASFANCAFARLIALRSSLVSSIDRCIGMARTETVFSFVFFAAAIINTADSLECFTCYGTTCPTSNQWVVETCMPNATICYTFFTDVSHSKTWKKGCAFNECAYAPGYTQGTACKGCSFNRCNTEGDEPEAGCIGRDCSQPAVKPWDPFVPGQGDGQGGGLSWGNGSSKIGAHFISLLSIVLFICLRFSFSS